MILFLLGMTCIIIGGAIAVVTGEEILPIPKNISEIISDASIFMAGVGVVLVMISLIIGMWKFGFWIAKLFNLMFGGI